MRGLLLVVEVGKKLKGGSWIGDELVERPVEVLVGGWTMSVG